MQTSLLKSMLPEELVNDVIEFYLGSADFNGLPSYVLVPDRIDTYETLRELLIPLVRSGVLSVNFGKRHINFHIRAFPDSTVEEQVSLLVSDYQKQYAIYPTKETLEKRINHQDYSNRPYTLRLALGEGQLEYQAFDLAVLDTYRRDPRFRLSTNDIHATMHIRDEPYESNEFPDKHKVHIQHFGFCFSENENRAVAVFLRDLSELTPEHQQLWFTHEEEGKHRLHPDYFRSAILGEFGEGFSLREALAIELMTINEMCKEIGWLPLFRNSPDELPPEIAFLLRPTLREYNDFIHSLDKLLSENINQTFFPDHIEREDEHVRDDGRIEVRRKGTLSLLQEWLKRHFRTKDPTPLNTAITTLKKVRKLRQAPAHSLQEDAYDYDLFEKQRLLFAEAYEAVRTLRLIIQNHPKAQKVRAQMDEQLIRGSIWPR